MKKRVIKNKCEASGYRLTGQDFYPCIEQAGVTVCATCGKQVKIREFNGMYFLPHHSVPTTKE